MIRTKWGWVLFFCSLCVMANVCLVQPSEAQAPAFQAQPLSKDMWQQKVDNVVFIIDTSSSMAEHHGGVQKLSTARDVIAHFNQTMPDVKVQTTVRSFGYDTAANKSTMTIFGPAAYSRAALADSLGKVREPAGPSLMDKALGAAGKDLKNASGKTAMVVISDGKELGSGMAAAGNQLKSAYGERLCIYTVLVGDDKSGSAALTSLSALTGCGKAVTAADVDSGSEMAEFVKTVLLTKVADSDGDGVADSADKCPNTPAGVAVDAAGCPPDSDGDGVADYRDKCIGTPKGTPVDADGCPLAPKPSKSAVVTKDATWLYKDIKFEINKADLLPGSHAVLDEIVDAMKAQPGLKVEVQGHTDISGTREYNMKLSERRAQTVVNYLRSKGIDASRITAKGYGPDKPMDSNKTADGRAANRRVELKPMQ